VVLLLNVKEAPAPEGENVNTGDQSKVYIAKQLQAQLNGFKAFGYQQLTVDNTVQNLTIPTGAKYALMVMESDLATTCARYLEFKGVSAGIDVVASGFGLPLSNGTVFDITDAQNLTGFQITEEAGGTHKLNIQYYK